MTLEQYRNFVLGGKMYHPHTLEGDQFENVINASNTSDRKPKGSTIQSPISWIFYWQALSGHHANEIKCAGCGKTIFVDTNTLHCSLLCAARKLKGHSAAKDSFQAIGSHIIRHYYGTGSRDQYYIIPLCRSCLSITDIFPITNTTICTEIDPVISH